MAKILHFECSRCKAHLSPESPQNVCPQCAGSLYVRYDLTPLRGLAHREEISRTAAAQPWAGMWRYKSVLPDAVPVSLGEGWTPMLKTRRHPNALFKGRRRESHGKLQSARHGHGRHHGAALRIEKTRGAVGGKCRGSAGGVCGCGRRESKRTSLCRKTCRSRIMWRPLLYGANVTLVDGLISDCGRIVAERKDEGRLVRCFHAERALSRGREKNDGLRTGGTTRLGISGRCFLSHGRRRGPDWNVEGI